MTKATTPPAASTVVDAAPAKLTKVAKALPAPATAKASAQPGKKTTASAPASKVGKASKPAVPKATAGKPAKPTAQKAAKLAEPKAPKLVRDSFTMPKDEYAQIVVLKSRLLKLAHPAKKSELMRAGFKALSAMSDAALLAAVNALPVLKVGRKKKD